MVPKFLAVALLSVWVSAAQPAGDLDAAVRRAMREYRVPGAAVGIVKDGRILHAKGYGLRDSKRRLPVTPGTIFATGSFSKSFTALVAAILVDEGKLEWDRPVREYLPWFRLHDPVATDLVTIRDMLAHRSGLPSYDFIRWAVPLEREELMRRLRYLEPNSTFRSGYQYNNLMYVAAGYLEGVVAGSTWERLVNERIFTPLRMDASNTSVLVSQRSPDYAKPHAIKSGEAEEIPFYVYQRFGVGPNGAVNSTLEDMLKYVAFQMNGGKIAGRQLISAAQLRQIHSPQVVVGDMAMYGLGWNIESYRGHKLVSHGGSITGFTAWMGFLPEENAGIVVLSNAGTGMPNALGQELTDHVLGLPAVPRNLPRQDSGMRAAAHPEAPASHELMDLAGDYQHPAFGPMRVQAEGDGLRLVFPARSISLKHHHYDVFTSAEGWMVQFQMDTQGEISSVSVPLEPAAKPVVFLRQR
ncbi:MAG TPA: serine hydrolase [Bryobacteraceae bacterium]|nr:serine hydrolase [Bryobacteraceae bacterium]